MAVATGFSKSVSLSADLEFVLPNYEDAQEECRSLFWDRLPLPTREICEKEMGHSYRFHICFVTTEKINNRDHWTTLKKAFISILKPEISKLRVDPEKAGAYLIQDLEGNYLPGRSPVNSPIVLYPVNKGDFANINAQMAEKLRELNTTWNTSYKLTSDLIPSHYSPHVTLVNRTVLNAVGQDAKKAMIGLFESILKDRKRGVFTLKDHSYNLT